MSTLLSLAPAWFLARYDFPGKRLVRAAFALPASLSGIMVGFLAIIMLGRVGFVPQMTARWFGTPWLSGAAYQMTGLIIAYLYFEIPRGVLSLEASLHKFDSQWMDAAMSLGASSAQRWRWVVLPLIRPALVSAFALTFSVSLGSFGVALILSRRFSVLPLEIFYRFTGVADAPLAAAMAVTLALIALLVQYALQVNRPVISP
jgi:putative spermidine/putrescine transport system permease protein